MDLTSVAIIGAGPYGLSLAAYLRGCGVPHRIFGSPMQSWRTQMPAGMFLKSEGFATNLAQPDGELTLKQFCNEAGYTYRDYGLPVPLQVFADYGMAFQRRFVPTVEDTIVRDIERHDHGFSLQLENGEQVVAQRVVVASGIHDFRYIPPSLARLPPELLSHTGEHHDYCQFKDRDVCVVGGGASATDVAAALHAAGANVHFVARRKELRWTSPRIKRPLFERWYVRDFLDAGRLGQGHFYSEAPNLFRYFPAQTRLRLAHSFLGPRGGWPVKECVERLPKSLGFTLERAEIRNGRVLLRLSGAGGETRELEADHIIAGTGYRIDLRRMPFLNPDLCADIHMLERAPALSANFESSVRGLYFIGISALYSFGPLLRFIAGTRFAARRVSAHLARSVPVGGQARRANAPPRQGRLAMACGLRQSKKRDANAAL
jgi:thioredoxin reductase